MEAYKNLNERAAASGLVDLVDLEWNRGESLVKEIIERVHRHRVLVIGSFHDFHETPSRKEVIRILCSIQALGADISKVAVMPRGRWDVMELLQASLAMDEEYADRPFITMSMGTLGAVSRLSGALTGSAVTFATAGRASAPGQMEAALLQQILPALQ